MCIRCFYKLFGLQSSESEEEVLHKERTVKVRSRISRHLANGGSEKNGKSESYGALYGEIELTDYVQKSTSETCTQETLVSDTRIV